MQAAQSMPALTKKMLISLAVASGVALAVMSYFGGFDAFPDPLMQYSASTIGLFADVGVPVFLFCMVFFFKRRHWFCLLLAAVFWLACSTFTVKQGATWLAHKLDAAQQPVEQAKRTAETAKEQIETNLKTERKNRDEAHELTLKGTMQAIRENASKQEDKAKAEIRRLETELLNQATAAPTEIGTAPVKSPLTGYELLVTFILWALSQGCWFMASVDAPAGAVQDQSEPRGSRTSKTPPPHAPRSTPKPKVQASGIVLKMEDRAKVVHADRFRGMSEQQIANQLGWTKSTVHRARTYGNKSFRGSVHAIA